MTKRYAATIEFNYWSRDGTTPIRAYLETAITALADQNEEQIVESLKEVGLAKMKRLDIWVNPRYTWIYSDYREVSLDYMPVKNAERANP